MSLTQPAFDRAAFDVRAFDCIPACDHAAAVARFDRMDSGRWCPGRTYGIEVGRLYCADCGYWVENVDGVLTIRSRA